jgi:hypothetical protein
MLNKYLSAIIAGVAFGILIGIMAAIPCLIIISFVLMVALGAFTVYLARGNINNSMDALLSSGLAGLISGITGSVVAIVSLATVAILIKTYNYDPISVNEMGRGLGIFSLICGPVLMVAGVLLSAIGGYIYYELAGKRIV